MTERILSPQLLKLVQQAGSGYSLANPEWVKKFAQLIAEDCAKMLDEDSYIIPELGGYAHDIRTRYGVK